MNQHKHAMNKDNVPWTGSEYALMQQRAAKRARMRRKRVRSNKR